MTDTYEHFVEDVSACTECKLHETRKSVVIHRGDPSSDLAFIGEAPGADEDEAGECFVGKSGREIDEWISRNDLEMYEPVLFNVLKCRPPGNKFPGHPSATVSLKAVHSCLPHLDRQFGLIDPKVVILVGGKAIAWTLYRERRPVPGVGKIVHKWIQCEDYPGVNFFALYHPSYVLRIRSMDPEKHESIQRQIDETLRWAKGLMDGVSPRTKPDVLKRIVSREEPVQERLF